MYDSDAESLENDQMHASPYAGRDADGAVLQNKSVVHKVKPCGQLILMHDKLLLCVFDAETAWMEVLQPNNRLSILSFSGS